MLQARRRRMGSEGGPIWPCSWYSGALEGPRAAAVAIIDSLYASALPKDSIVADSWCD